MIRDESRIFANRVDFNKYLIVVVPERLLVICNKVRHGNNNVIRSK